MVVFARMKVRCLVRHFALYLAITASLITVASSAHAQWPDARQVMDALGPHSISSFGSTSTQTMSALVRLPSGVRARDLGLEPVATGIARVQGSPSRVRSVLAAHPDLRAEVAPELHLLNRQAGQAVKIPFVRERYGYTGAGVLVGVADTGIDLTHADFLRDDGTTRVAWIMDLSQTPLGVHADLERKFGVVGDDGTVLRGRVLSAADINTRFKTLNTAELPIDEEGHGSHVASIAAGDDSIYEGAAPGAELVIARISSASGSITNDDLLRAVGFMFDRAEFMQRPMVVNLSLGTDFGPHDGSTLWEQTVASYVGSDKPGRAIIAAAGNSGSIVETRVHQAVHVNGGRARVTVRTNGSTTGSQQVWVTMQPGSDLTVGLEAPTGEWIAQTEEGNYASYQKNNAVAAVIHGSKAKDSPVPAGSKGAVVVWQNVTPAGVYAVTLEGRGRADLYFQASGDARVSGSSSAVIGFEAAVRERTVNLPASHPDIVAVGCTVSRVSWTSVNHNHIGLRAPGLDAKGSLPSADPSFVDINYGDSCWFGSAGPNARGVLKPEVSAPGAAIIAAMSTKAPPASPASVFYAPTCVGENDTPDPACLQVDPSHAVSMGTSMSSPLVAGAVALLFQRSPTLTQDRVKLALMAGTHKIFGRSPFDDQSGPGELDVPSAISVLEQIDTPQVGLPVREKSWLVASTMYAVPDGATPVYVLLELRTSNDTHADGFDTNRLRVYARVDGTDLPGSTVERLGPGLYAATIVAPEGSGGQNITFGVTLDGNDIVEPRTLPISFDSWRAAYPSQVGGGCSFVPFTLRTQAGALALLVGSISLVMAMTLRRRRSS